VNADDVRDIKFRKGTYDLSEVDELLDRMASEIAAGRRAGPLIANAAFHQRSAFRGYDARAVDWFLDQLRRNEDPAEAALAHADPWRDLAADPFHIHRDPGALEGRAAPPPASRCADEWREFSEQPGTRLMWVRTGAMRYELRTAKQYPLVIMRRGLATTLTTGERTFKTKAGGRTPVPGISEVINRDRPGYPARTMRGAKDIGRPPLRHILDEAGLPILFSGGRHISRIAGAYIVFPSQRWLRFPVRGARRANVIMTAVDQAGIKVARYRIARNEPSSRKGIQITVRPASN